MYQAEVTCQIILPPPPQNRGEPWRSEFLWYQSELMLVDAEIILALWGIGTGKTLTGAVKFLTILLQHQGIWGMIISPTMPMFEENIRPILDELDRLWFGAYGWKLIAKWTMRNGSLQAKLFNGSAFMVRSGEKPSAIRGQTVGVIWIDELSSMRMADDVWKRAVGRCRGRGPQIKLITTTPLGDEGPIRMIRRRRKEGADNIFISRVKTSQNPYLSPQFLEEQRQSLSREEYLTECEAEIIPATGLVYADFRRETHLIDFSKQDLYHGGWASVLAVDWGSGHAHAVWLAVKRGEYYPQMVVYDELGLDNSTDEAMIEAVVRRSREYGYPIRAIAPDPANGDSCRNLYRAIKRCGWGTKGYWEWPPELKLIRVSAEYVRRGLMNAKGEVNLRFARSLLTNGLNGDGGYGIIQAVEHYRKKVGREKGTYQDTPYDDSRNTHACDALRYAVRCVKGMGYTMAVESAAARRPERGIPITDEE